MLLVDLSLFQNYISKAVPSCHHNCLISMHDEFCVCLHRQALAPKGVKGAPPPPQEEGPRTILKMTQKFGHNPEVPAEQDVAKRVFDIANGRIRSAHTLIITPYPPSPLNPLHPSSPAPSPVLSDGGLSAVASVVPVG